MDCEYNISRKDAVMRGLFLIPEYNRINFLVFKHTFCSNQI